MSEFAERAAELLVTPDPQNPDLSLVRIGDYPLFRKRGKERAPLAFRFSELAKAPSAITEFQKMLAATLSEDQSTVDLITGIHPGGTRFSYGLSTLTGIPHTQYTPSDRQLCREDTSFKKGANCVVVDELFSLGNTALFLKDAFLPFGVKVERFLSVVSYEFPARIRLLESQGVTSLHLTTLEYVLNHPEFVNRFGPKTKEDIIQWYLIKRDIVW